MQFIVVLALVVLTTLTLQAPSRGAMLVDFEQYPEGPVAQSFIDADTGIEFQNIGLLNFSLNVDYVTRNSHLPTGNYLSAGLSTGDGVILIGGDWAKIRVVLPELVGRVTAQVWASNAHLGSEFPVTLQAFDADDLPAAPPVVVNVPTGWSGNTLSLDLAEPRIKSFTILPDPSLGAIFDNIGYAVVPEPSLAVLVAIPLLRRRARKLSPETSQVV